MEEHQSNCARVYATPTLAVLRCKAEQLSAEYKINCDDSLDCLIKICEAKGGGILNEPVELAYQLDAFPLNAFAEACERLSGARAVDLVRSNEIPSLIARIEVARCIVQHSLPAFTLAELTDLVREFADFLRLHRDYIVQHGLSPRYFSRCPWLHIQLGRLYDARTTTSPYSFDELFHFQDQSRVESVAPYRWCRYPEHGCFALKEIQECRYEEASFHRGLDPESANRIERDRAKLFDLRLALLNTLGAVEPQTTTGRQLLQRCLAQMATILDVDELAFYLELDRWYIGSLSPEKAWSPEWSPGGISNLLAVVNRFEGAIDLARLNPKLDADMSVLRTTLEDGCENDDPQWAYFQVLNHFEKDRLTSVLDWLVAESDSHGPLWLDLETRSLSALDSEPRLTVAELNIPADLINPIKDLLRQHVEALKIKKDSDAEKLRPGAPPEPTFKLCGDVFHIVFDGEEGHRKSEIAERYFHKLLSEPGQRFSPIDLKFFGNPPKSDGMAPELTKQDRLSTAIDSLDFEMDESTKQACIARIVELEKKAAIGAKTAEGQDALTELNQIAKYIGAATFKGNVRQFNNRTILARKAVNKSLRSAYKNLADNKFPKLAQHLKDSIDTRGGYCYRPEAPLSWKT